MTSEIIINIRKCKYNKEMEKIPRSKTSETGKTTTTIESILFFSAIAMLLVSTITFGNTAPQHLTNNNAYAQTSSTTLEKPIFRGNMLASDSKVVEVTNNTATIESNYSGNGTVIVANGSSIPVTVLMTVVGTYDSTGQFNGKGQGLLRTHDGASTAAYTLTFTGSNLTLQANSNPQGSINFNDLTTGNLANLNNTNGIFKAQIEPISTYTTLEAWEQK